MISLTPDVYTGAHIRVRGCLNYTTKSIWKRIYSCDGLCSKQILLHFRAISYSLFSFRKLLSGKLLSGNCILEMSLLFRAEPIFDEENYPHPEKIFKPGTRPVLDSRISYFHSVSLNCIHPCLCPRNSGPGIKLDKWFYLNLRILWTKERGQLTLNTWQNWRFWFDSQSDAVLKSNIQHFGHESLWTNISILLLFPQPCFNFLTENLVSHKSWLIMVTQTTYLTALSSGNFMMSCKKRPSWSG